MASPGMDYSFIEPGKDHIANNWIYRDKTTGNIFSWKSLIVKCISVSQPPDEVYLSKIDYMLFKSWYTF